MKLKLRKGWQTCKTDCEVYLYPPGEIVRSKGWIVNMDLDAGIVWVHRNGKGDSRKFKTIEEAHAYLLSVGSKSPWEVVC